MDSTRLDLKGGRKDNVVKSTGWHSITTNFDFKTLTTFSFVPSSLPMLRPKQEATHLQSNMWMYRSFFSLCELKSQKQIPPEVRVREWASWRWSNGSLLCNKNPFQSPCGRPPVASKRASERATVWVTTVVEMISQSQWTVAARDSIPQTVSSEFSLKLSSSSSCLAEGEEKGETKEGINSISSNQCRHSLSSDELTHSSWLIWTSTASQSPWHHQQQQQQHHHRTTPH